MMHAGGLLRTTNDEGILLYWASFLKKQNTVLHVYIMNNTMGSLT